ncbi:MAG: TolC family protein, partial [Muribaculaceae bacterium]|nr:TolC family protein [Muribaculaceae bacterium]
MRTHALLHILLPLAALGGMLLPSSCSGVRQCQAPQLVLPEETVTGIHSADSATVADMDWWKFYSDSTLCLVIRKTLANNRDMLAAAANVEAARQAYLGSRADRLPSVGVLIHGEQETRDYSGKFVRDPEFDLKASLSWEADLWGKYRWAKRGGQARWAGADHCQVAEQVGLVV